MTTAAFGWTARGRRSTTPSAKKSGVRKAERNRRRPPRLKRIRADGGYAGKLVAWTKSFGGWILDIVKRSNDVIGFTVLRKRWIVERTFARIGRYRRMSKDYEVLPENRENMILISLINLMLHRLAPG